MVSLNKKENRADRNTTRRGTLKKELVEARNKALTALELCSLTLQVSKYLNCGGYREKDFWPSDILNFTNMAGNKEIVLIEV